MYMEGKETGIGYCKPVAAGSNIQCYIDQDNGNLFFRIDGEDMGMLIQNNKDIQEGAFYFTAHLNTVFDRVTIVNPSPKVLMQQNKD